MSCFPRCYVLLTADILQLWWHSLLLVDKYNLASVYAKSLEPTYFAIICKVLSLSLLAYWCLVTSSVILFCLSRIEQWVGCPTVWYSLSRQWIIAIRWYRCLIQLISNKRYFVCYCKCQIRPVSGLVKSLLSCCEQHCAFKGLILLLYVFVMIVISVIVARNGPVLIQHDVQLTFEKDKSRFRQVSGHWAVENNDVIVSVQSENNIYVYGWALLEAIFWKNLFWLVCQPHKFAIGKVCVGELRMF